ncbi:phosphatase PAP2 family protein [Lactobacillus jensenii]|jgi:membrane-associated phospholipid phosphatase|uniref:Phosphatase PAP2 family protein n=1 Tax=Lactobacillus jensenii TaxID=109790 RepID=A0ABU9FLS1_LACJE|nr:phosphatase PAP2 family protein [Lactobacillus jensenii]ERJ43359.1 phospholipid phosphatase [Lactobacillus jensenii MD IIE-70(2)]MCT7875531.1 phosphatase PAP2 family protein [Lactobacillus iners]APT14348.1 phospholipid phosphatase [Lactobacillus jensenii]EEQ24397.1 PAP2 family protein [Lactobacillus jensenii 269-3]EEX28145.1 PAP2 family protein [Lactobacillus jensenii SJ-7A-US]
MKEKNYLTCFSILAIISSAFYAFWAFSVAYQASFIKGFDKLFINLIANQNKTELFILKHLTVLANTPVVIGYTVVLVIFLLLKRKYALAGFSTFVMALANGNNWLLKHIVQRPRPAVSHLVKATGYSFPSGHSAGSMSICLVLFVVVLILMNKGLLKRLLLIILPIIPFIIGMSRIYVHVHYPSDVLGGFIEAITYFLLGLLIFQSKLFKNNDK